MPRSTKNVWAKETRIGQNRVRQLLVRECTDVGTQRRADGTLVVHSSYGVWPARRGSAIGADEQLTASLPVLDPGSGPISWRGSRELHSPETVLDSFDGAIGFTAHDQPNSLRRPQIAALHSIVGYQSSGLSEPGIVVMPTGTGKTETMLAWLVAQRPSKVLVIVPSRALRDQIASKFETLGVLQQAGIVSPKALRPCVGRLEHRFADQSEARAFIDACNVVVATPSVIHSNDPLVRDVLGAEFSHLIVDEAHHSPATTWTEIIRAFAGRPVLLFTATPYRRDGRVLPGRVIFRFPLREAQREGYFSSIDFTAVLDLDGDDESLARAALDRLREDLVAGYQHVLLARAGTKSRADEIHALYSRLAPDFAPCVLHDSLPARTRTKPLKRSACKAAA